MQQTGGLALFMTVGVIGGLIGMKIKLPGSVIICSMLAVILTKAFLQSGMTAPGYLTTGVQILLGVMVGMGYTPALAKQFTAVAWPVIGSTLLLVSAGLLMAVILVKMNLLNIPDAYLSTSPGAMSALLSLSLDSSANPGIVAAFHFFRLTFIILTAPLAFHLLQNLVSRH